jgi:hypothetical protein
VKEGLLPKSVLHLVVGVAFVSMLAACASPVGVRRIDAKAVHRELTENAISAEVPSSYSRQLLNRLGLAAAFDENPEATLAALHEGLGAQGDEDRVFALAELSFLYGEKSKRREYSLAAAVYAAAFLFPGELGSSPAPFDPRLQVARNVYNRGLALALTVSISLALVRPGPTTLLGGRFFLQGASEVFGFLSLICCPHQYGE